MASPPRTSSAAANLPGKMQVEKAAQPFAIAIAYSRCPLPMTRADQMTVAHLISFLSARGHAIDLYALDTGEEMTGAQTAWLHDHCRSVTMFPHGRVRSALGALAGLLRGFPLQVGWFSNGAQKKAVRSGLAQVDVGYAYYIRSAETMRGVTGKATYLAMQLSQSLNTRRMVEQYKKLSEKALYAVESRLLRGYEARVWRDFTRTVLIGPQDVAEIAGICREKSLPEIDNVFFGPHGTDISRFKARDDVEVVPNSLVFNGVLRTYTNVHAITWFAAHVWPLVRAAVPDATMMIVGRDPKPEVVALGNLDGVTVTGEVKEPADYIARAAVCIDPVQAGAGMQNKLVEFMAAAKPVVATTVANEGIGAMPGEHLVLADRPEEMASEILRLFAAPDQAREMGAAARKFVQENWTWEAHFLRLEEDMIASIAAVEGEKP